MPACPSSLYQGVNAFVGHMRGGLAMASIGACAGFGAICGSSLATAATMCRVALPEMRRHGYDDRLAAASIAAGGTLGVLIPPSILLVIYALLTEQSIGALFAAALIPGSFWGPCCTWRRSGCRSAAGRNSDPAPERLDWPANGSGPCVPYGRSCCCSWS